MTEEVFIPDVSCPRYDEFAKRYGGEILLEIGDLQLVDGDLAMTRDFDLMLGDKPYDAMRRLLEDWRWKAPHLKMLFHLSDLMVVREGEVHERLERAENEVRSGEYKPFMVSASPVFQKAWQAHFDETASAQSGRDVYPTSIVLQGSYALGRFRDDISCNGSDWKTCGPLFGGRSVGEILTASANGARHQDEWFKSHRPDPRQSASMQVLTDALGEHSHDISPVYSAGRCEEVLALIGQSRGFDGFTESMFKFAHHIAMNCRQRI